ncbi:MAG TPA: hypothetical protein VL093_05840 [Flavipsychrobacter sp.]|nr:hypothetical protein [Flavipsychrobacter sp.]
MVIGRRSILMLGGLFLACAIIFSSLAKREAEVFVSCIMILFLYGMFLFNIFILEANQVVVKFIWNPFKKNVQISYEEIKEVVIIRNTMRGSSTIVKFFLADEKHIDISTCIIKKEEDVLADILSEKGILVKRINI